MTLLEGNEILSTPSLSVLDLPFASKPLTVIIRILGRLLVKMLCINVV